MTLMERRRALMDVMRKVEPLVLYDGGYVNPLWGNLIVGEGFKSGNRPNWVIDTDKLRNPRSTEGGNSTIYGDGTIDLSGFSKLCFMGTQTVEGNLGSTTTGVICTSISTSSTYENAFIAPVQKETYRNSKSNKKEQFTIEINLKEFTGNLSNAMVAIYSFGVGSRLTSIINKVWAE